MNEEASLERQVAHRLPGAHQVHARLRVTKASRYLISSIPRGTEMSLIWAPGCSASLNLDPPSS